jgi:hypothetical protein
LLAPLVRRPRIYLADVSAGPAGYQRLVIDARGGQILERFTASGRMWGPTAAGPTGSSAYGASANFQIPDALGPYGRGEPPLGTKARAKAASTERKAQTAKTASNPPLPPPAPREAARPDGSGSPVAEPPKAAEIE